jgi:glycine cleavage system H protein
MSEMKFTKAHVWVRLESTGVVTIGITNHAQHALGDIVYVEVPEIGEIISAGKECAVIESVKTASDITSPLSGEVIEVNEDVIDSPELVNEDPQNAGWLLKIKPANIKELASLMDIAEYTKYLAELAH